MLRFYLLSLFSHIFVIDRLRGVFSLFNVMFSIDSWFVYRIRCDIHITLNLYHQYNIEDIESYAF